LAETAIYKLLDEDFISVPLLAFLVHAYQDYPEDSPAERYDKAIWVSALLLLSLLTLYLL
jgi:hypothetical protein